MRLVLLRHGRTVAARGTLVGSRVDVALDDVGRSQAVAAGERLDGRGFDLVVSSPLRRARETASLAFPHAVPRIEPRLQELDWGDLTGLTWSDIEQNHPATAAEWARVGWPVPPNGEDPRALWRRVAAALLDLHAEAFDGDVAVVCHGGVIRAALGAARGLGLADAWRVRTPHAAVRIQRVTPRAISRWRAVLEGDRGSLPAMGVP
jgi:broad specificity phosphatase PhoE